MYHSHVPDFKFSPEETTDRTTAGCPATGLAADLGLSKAEAIEAACFAQAGPPLWVQVVS